MSTLPLVDVFEFPYEVWRTREQSFAEIKESGSCHLQVKEELLSTINNHVEAATHILNNSIDNLLDNFIKKYLNNSKSFKEMRDMMPSITPKILSEYQKNSQNINFNQVSIDINANGATLSEEQYLFHGGFLDFTAGDSIVTNRPLSTSFCPQIALRNSEWMGKAYDVGEINIFVLRAINPRTKTFCYKLNGTDNGHEAEVLFATGANLVLKRKTFVKNGNVYKACTRTFIDFEKEVPFYVLEVDIS